MLNSLMISKCEIFKKWRVFNVFWNTLYQWKRSVAISHLHKFLKCAFLVPCIPPNSVIFIAESMEQEYKNVHIEFMSGMSVTRELKYQSVPV